MYKAYILYIRAKIFPHPVNISTHISVKYNREDKRFDGEKNVDGQGGGVLFLCLYTNIVILVILFKLLLVQEIRDATLRIVQTLKKKTLINKVLTAIKLGGRG